MKQFGYILAFYIIALAAIPCCIIDKDIDDKTAQAEKQDNADEDCKGCSPFFNCEGCTAATVACQPLAYEFVSLTMSPVYTVYQQSSLTEADHDFWQPPKLV